MNKKSNKRYQKNKQRIQTTLIFLLQEKELSKITVQEICETLDINRSTFYYHYMDIFDLAEQVFKETNRRLLERMRKEFHLIPFSEKSAILFF
ncbi:TetR/AcrR family transcriptional regulator [Enterococcus thailandicus]|uniref:TetR/AcrR family transcriptional regulator n=1 Tax=Enterococcus thailandicus TaxID=417368 RepID=UPI0022E7FDAF|nr:TetR/AcrR family transcriptional regulator [Enterococcus thailandicus]